MKLAAEPIPFCIVVVADPKQNDYRLFKSFYFSSSYVFNSGTGFISANFSILDSVHVLHVHRSGSRRRPIIHKCGFMLIWIHTCAMCACILYNVYAHVRLLFVFPSNMVWFGVVGIPVLQKQPVRMMILSLSAIL